MRLRSESRQIQGEFGEAVPRGKARVIAMFFGMLDVTVCGLLRTPAFYALLALSRWRGARVSLRDEENEIALARSSLSRSSHQLRRALVFLVPAQPS